MQQTALTNIIKLWVSNVFFNKNPLTESASSCSNSFFLTSGILCLCLGPIPSGLVHLKRNKGLRGTYASFYPLHRGTTPLCLASSPSNTPRDRALTPLECLASKRSRFQRHSMATLYDTVIWACSSVLLLSF